MFACRNELRRGATLVGRVGSSVLNVTQEVHKKPQFQSLCQAQQIKEPPRDRESRLSGRSIKDMQVNERSVSLAVRDLGVSVAGLTIPLSSIVPRTLATTLVGGSRPIRNDRGPERPS